MQINRKSGFWLVLPLIAGLAATYPTPATCMEDKEGMGFELDVPRKFQPDFESSRQYSHDEMEELAGEVLIRMENQLDAPFNRRDPQHVWALAEFFGLTPQEDLDPYSTPMEEGDAYYFAEADTHQHAELYPQTAHQLVIRFYWEGLARLGAAYYKFEVVNERKARNPVKSRGKVSDIRRNMASYVQVFNSDTQDYHPAFQSFLDHTNQKHKAKQWMEAFVGTLSQKRLFLDAGAGKVTAWFAGQFERAIALEPNPSLCGELRTVCPDAEIYQQTILDANIKASANFILASHVFYYIPKEDWTANLARLASWFSPQGALVVMLQNAGTDCMGMLRHFFKKSFDLKGLFDDFKSMHGCQYVITMETVSSHITTTDFKSAYAIAEFMMNLLSMPPPLRKDLKAYVEKNFAAESGGYRFSCHQDFLQIRPAGKMVSVTL